MLFVCYPKILRKHCLQFLNLGSFFCHRKFTNCLLKHSEIWKKGQFKHQKLLRYLRTRRQLVREIAQNATSCSKRNIRWPKLRNNLWKALIQPIHYHSPQAENYYSAVSLAEIMFVYLPTFTHYAESHACGLLRLLKDIDLTHL